MRIRPYIAVTAALFMSGPAFAQQADANVDSYLCTFAGKCGPTTVDAPTKAAPATKGFRLAAAQAAPASSAAMIPAPATKSFRIAKAQADAPVRAIPAPTTKSFRLATAKPSTASHRSIASNDSVAHASAAPAGAGTRANLMLAFHYNSDEMTEAAKTTATTFAQALQMPELKTKRFLIEGHTDARGPRDLNIDLSRRRAQSVADFLVAQGVDRSRVEVKGIGPDQPLPGRAATAEANRRVEAVLLS